MQGRDEYEADYYGGAPVWPGNECVMTPQRGCCQGRINELLEEMERALSMQSENVRMIVTEIRKICGSIDGRGCMAIECEPDRKMIDMLFRRVMERLERLPGNYMDEMSDMNDYGEAVEAAAWRDEPHMWYRDLVETLIWQELMRRKMRRRMNGRKSAKIRKI